MLTLKIKVRTTHPDCRFSFIDKGEWIDLKVDANNEHVNLKAGELKYISLGVAMQLPPDFEALVLPRSSTPKNYGITLANSQGVIDSSYSGNEDIWRFIAHKSIGDDEVMIPHAARIAQFKIQPSQKASMWTKLKWLFTSKIEFEFVDRLKGNNRGGIGSTGL